MSLTQEKRTVNLRHYAPATVAPAKEMQGVYIAESDELATVWDKAWNCTKSTFVYDLDECGFERWESMLSIVPEVGATEEERRASILAKISSYYPITERSLRQKLESIFNTKAFTISLNCNAYSLTVNTALDNTFLQNLLRKYCRCIIPANLGLTVGTQTKTWNDVKLGTYNYGETIWLSYKNNWDNWSYVKYLNTLEN